MLFIVNKNIHPLALKKLYVYGEVLLFATEGITYKGIENHPDIFLTQIDSQTLLYAPNTPEIIPNTLKKTKCLLIQGGCPIGLKHPLTTHYNAVVTDKFLVHNTKYTDPILKKLCEHRELIHIAQAYTRCNLVALPNGNFITSDNGICKSLSEKGFNTIFINPLQIKLEGFKHGFFGGCCGVINNKLFINGSIKNLQESGIIRSLFIENHLEIIELNQNQPEDIGSIFILE